VSQKIRKHALLGKEDSIPYKLQGDAVVFHEVTLLDLDYFQTLNAMLSEWEADDDEQAYKNLVGVLPM